MHTAPDVALGAVDPYDRSLPASVPLGGGALQLAGPCQFPDWSASTTKSHISIGVQSERELRSAMARVRNPTLFSAYFREPPQALAAAGLIDPFLDVDVPLFIDPVLLEKSSNKTIATSAIARFRKHFEILVRMLNISKAEDDAAWKGARRQLDLSEPPENGLGYGGSGRSGNSRPEDIREAILRTSGGRGAAGNIGGTIST